MSPTPVIAGQATAARNGSRLPMRSLRKSAADPQPTQAAAVLLASPGPAFTPALIARAVALADGEPVAVISIARIYGSSLGLPNPGLMPTRKELDGQRAQVAAAVAALEREGLQAWGQVAATRRPGRTIARAAIARHAGTVVLLTPDVAPWRRVVEGNPVSDIRRHLPRTTTVEGVLP
jgi:hypothetical protein